MTVFPPAFDYHRATDVEGAVDLLVHYRDRDPRLLAGGHSLVPDLKAGRDDPGVVVDLAGIDDLRGVEAGVGRDGDGDGVTIGATTTYADALDSDLLAERAPGFAEAVAAVGDRQIRNRGTVGGNLAACEVGADLPPAALAADATLRVRGPDGERAVAVDEFFDGSDTALEPTELLTAVHLPGSDDGRQSGSTYVKKTHPARGYAMVGVAVRVAVEGRRVASARVAVTGVTGGPVRLGTVEDAVRGEPARDVAVEAVAARAGTGLDSTRLHGDAHGSGEFRVRVLPTYVERALERAVDRAVSRPADHGSPAGNDGAGGPPGGDDA